MTSYRAAPLLLLFMFACEQCNEEDGGLTQRGSVANAPVGQGTLRTEDGVEVIMPQRREDPPPRPDHGNLVREPDSPDPHGGNFSLEEAVEGLPTDGQLVAEFNTTFGTFFCDLYAEKTPRTVANFIGLARGTRAWWDARQAEWRTAPAFQDTQIFRVLPGFLIQGGDYLDDGTGTVGYNLPAEPHPELSHDRPGQLCVATTGANEGGAQWFITDGPAPRLDDDEGQHTIFGQCRPEELVRRLARVPQADENRPRTPIIVRDVRIRRVRGGAANATATPPGYPEGVDPDRLGYEASASPTEQNLTASERAAAVERESAEREARLRRLRQLREGTASP